jgi:flavodoxin
VDLNPDNMDFFKKLRAENPDLSSTTVALFNLGDKYYEVFCAAVPVVKKTFTDLGARLYRTDLNIDGYPTPDVLEPLKLWAKEAMNEYKKTSTS